MKVFWWVGMLGLFGVRAYYGEWYQGGKRGEDKRRRKGTEAGCWL